LVRTDPGFDADHLLVSVVIPAPDRYKTPEERGILYGKFLDAVRALPGVESAGTVDALPFSGENHGAYVTNSKTGVTEPNSQTVAEVDIVSADYLQTMGVRLIEGRWFREGEMKPSNDTAIVNDVLGARMWPGTSPIDKQICVYCTPEKPNNWKRVVGVVSNVRHAAMDAAEQPNVYLSAGALEESDFLVVRTNRPTKDLETGIRRAIAGVDPDQPVFLSASMRSLVADSLASRRFIMSLLAITACIALAMSVAGVYGVTSYTASRRTQEIGVRMALGATPGNVQLLVFRQGFLTTAIGLAIGLGATLALMRVLRGMLVGLESEKLAEMLIAVGVVSVTAALACWVPALRASRIDPMAALRHD
jgi:predicted permease